MFKDLVSEQSSQEDEATKSVRSNDEDNYMTKTKTAKKVIDTNDEKLAIWRQSLIVDDENRLSKDVKSGVGMFTPKIRKNLENGFELKKDDKIKDL